MPWSVSLPRCPGLQRGKYSPLWVSPIPHLKMGQYSRTTHKGFRRPGFPDQDAERSRPTKPYAGSLSVTSSVLQFPDKIAQNPSSHALAGLEVIVSGLSQGS